MSIAEGMLLELFCRRILTVSYVGEPNELMGVAHVESDDVAESAELLRDGGESEGVRLVRADGDIWR